MISFEQSGAFVERFDIAPTGDGPLDGLTFAVKDLIDVQGFITGGGNPSWREAHDPAQTHAVCVEQLLAAGARGIGKTITDELAFSLLGENHWYGTPLNPAAPDRMPGGSSSGSASAVACGLADLALGTDTGGSVRVPASNCGILGFRPTHGRISIAGVLPLAPTYDAVGLFARDFDVLTRGMAVLLGRDPVEANVGRLRVLASAFDQADEVVRESLRDVMAMLRQRYDVADAALDVDFAEYLEAYRELQGLETWSCLGDRIAKLNLTFGPRMAPGFQFIRQIHRADWTRGMRRRERLAAEVCHYLSDGTILVMPTSPTLALPKGAEVRRDAGPNGYYARTLGFTAVAGVGRCPQISLPLGRAGGVPMGLSLIAAPDRDMELLAVAEAIFRECRVPLPEASV